MKPSHGSHRSLPGVACVALTAALWAGPAIGEGGVFDAGWAADPVWDDGRAEVAVYDAGRPIYGADRPYQAVLITVKEDFDVDRLVKADPPHGDREVVTVLKLNAVREIETPNYPYRMMTSVFVLRDDPATMLKLTSGSHEWCGNTWKSVRRRDGVTTYSWQSYFDGEVDGRQTVRPGPDDLFEDQLALVLRGLPFRDGWRRAFRLAPTMATTHGGPFRWRDVTLTVHGPETLRVPAGRFEAWRVELDGGVEATWWFDREGTHRLLKMRHTSGEYLDLASVERRAYWKLP